MEGPAAVSDSLVYNPRPSAVTGSKIRQNIQCYNLPEAGQGRVIMFNIPCGRRGQFLRPRASYLKFRVNNKGANALVPDYNAHALIRRLELYHGSNLLEQISEYNVLAHILKDIQSGLDHQQTVCSVLEGTLSATASVRLGSSIASNGSDVFCIQLLSGIIGGLQEKYVPVGEMVGDLRLELTLAGSTDPFTGAAPNWTLSEMELMLEYVELSDAATAMVAQQNPRGFMMSFDSFANYSSTLPAGTFGMNILIPARYSVLKTLFTSIRSDANKVATSRTITNRINLFNNDGSGEWYYSVGGKNMPATPVKTTAEAFGELMKAQHALGSAAAPTVLTASTWRSATDGSYIIAQDLEYLHGKSARASNGVNTLSINTRLIGRFGNATGTTGTHTIDTFAHYEGVLMIVNGIAQSQI